MFFIIDFMNLMSVFHSRPTFLCLSLLTSGLISIPNFPSSNQGPNTSFLGVYALTVNTMTLDTMEFHDLFVIAAL